MNKLFLFLLLCFNSFLVCAPQDITENFFKQAEFKFCPDLQKFVTKITFVKYSETEEICLKNEGLEIGRILVRKNISSALGVINYIDELTVDENYQKKGIGSTLLLYALRLCQCGCVATRLTAIPDSLTSTDYQRLKKFYTRHGGELDPQSEKGNFMGSFTFKRTKEQSS